MTSPTRHWPPVAVWSATALLPVGCRQRLFTGLGFLAHSHPQA